MAVAAYPEASSAYRNLTSTRGMTLTESSSGSGSSGSSAEASSAGSGATNALSANYNMFLQILTTQLRTQNPLQPTDADKFTQQLVQYSSVEQQIQTNDQLKSLLATMVSSTALNLVNYIGKNVVAASTVTKLADGKAAWTLNAPKAADGATITIKNEAGAVVYTGKMDLKSGDNKFEWDGKTSSGTTAPNGNYKIEVTATDKDGKSVTVASKVSGMVTAVDTSGNEPYLKINGQLVPLSGLIQIGE